MTIRGGGDPTKTMASKPLCRMDPPPRSFATDAHDCIMVRSSRIDRIQGCGAIDDRARQRAPLGHVIPTIASVPPCSGLSRRGLETTEREALAERRPALTAPCARRRPTRVGRDEETGFQVEQRNWEERKVENAVK